MRIFDYSSEYGATGFNTADGITVADANALANAAAGLSIGTLTTVDIITTANAQTNAATVPTSAFAQRELKYLVRYQDNVNGRVFNHSIACADAAQLGAGSDYLDISAGAAATFVTAFEAQAISPYGNAVTVLSIQLVGRNT